MDNHDNKELIVLFICDIIKSMWCLFLVSNLLFVTPATLAWIWVMKGLFMGSYLISEWGMVAKGTHSGKDRGAGG